jgi:hypothetical protein
MRIRPILFALLVAAVPAVPAVAASGSGSGGDGGGGSTTGFLQNVFFDTPSVIGGQPTAMLVSFTQPAPAGGWTISIRSASAALQVPSTFVVPAGAFVVNPPVTTSVVASTTTATATVTLLGQSKSNSLTIFPANPTLGAPSLQSPGNGAKLSFRRLTTFDWTDVANAAWYELQIDSNTAFLPPFAINVGPTQSFWAGNAAFGIPSEGVPETGVKYWRVRAVSASGTTGPWSSVRSLTVRPQ